MRATRRNIALDETIASDPTSGLRDCAAVELRLMRGAGAMSDELLDCPGGMISAAEHAVPARRMLFRERDTLDFIPVICWGWAACCITLFDGRRQILGFLLPGDLAPAVTLFERYSHFSIEAVTDLRYRRIVQTEFKSVLMSNADLFDKFSRLMADEKAESDQLAVDLGRRSADERIARLVLRLAGRMKQRGLADGDTFEFPLRQHHIADATGLTSVHVSKVFTEFRRAGYIEITERSLTIKDEAAFRSIANMR